MTHPDRIAAYARDTAHYTGDGRSEDGVDSPFPPLVSQDELDRMGHFEGPDSFAVAVFVAGSLACFVAGFVIGVWLW